MSATGNYYYYYYYDEATFADRLKELRLSQNLTLEQLATIIGATKGTLANFENKNKKPSLDILISLANYFDVSLDYLVGRSENKARL